MHFIYTLYTSYIHFIYILYTFHLHLVYILYTFHIHLVHILYTCYILLGSLFQNFLDMFRASFGGRKKLFSIFLGDVWDVFWHHRWCLRRGRKILKICFRSEQKVRPKMMRNHPLIIFHRSNNSYLSPGVDLCTFRFYIFSMFSQYIPFIYLIFLIQRVVGTSDDANGC